MGAQGIYMANECHLINLIPPVDVNGGKVISGQPCFHMGRYQHATIVLQFGVSSAASTVILKNCTSAAGAGATAIAARYHACATGYTAANGDVLGAKTTLATTGLSMGGTSNTFYVIEVDAADLTDGYPWVGLTFSNGAASLLASCLVILSGAKIAQDQSPTEIA